MKFSEVKPRPEKLHLEPQESKTVEDMDILGKRTFIGIHNRKSINEY